MELFQETTGASRPDASADAPVDMLMLVTVSIEMFKLADWSILLLTSHEKGFIWLKTVVFIKNLNSIRTQSVQQILPKKDPYDLSYKAPFATVF